MRKLLLDTCILLDECDGTRPHSSASRDLIDCCYDKEIPLLYSITSAQNVEYLLQQSLKQRHREGGGEVTSSTAAGIHAMTAAHLDNLSSIATAVGADESDLWLARKLSAQHLDFEDCLVLAAMERSKADFLVTNDEDLIKRSPYPTLTPEDMLAYLEANPVWCA